MFLHDQKKHNQAYMYYATSLKLRLWDWLYSTQGPSIKQASFGSRRLRLMKKRKEKTENHRYCSGYEQHPVNCLEVVFFGIWSYLIVRLEYFAIWLVRIKGDWAIYFGSIVLKIYFYFFKNGDEKGENHWCLYGFSCHWIVVKYEFGGQMGVV